MKYFSVLVLWMICGTSEAQTVRVRLPMHLQTLVLQVDSASLQGTTKIESPETLKISYMPILSKWQIEQGNKKTYFTSPTLELAYVKDGKKAKWFLSRNLENNNVEVIEKVPLEDYLHGVLPAEMPLSWPEESLKAQVIASRSYVLAQIRKNKNSHFDVDSTVMDQVYDSDWRNTVPAKYQSKLRQILKDTANMVLVDSKHKILTAYFHSQCGGYTESPQHVWQVKSPLKAVVDPYCMMSAQSQWYYDVGPRQIENAYFAASKEKSTALTKMQDGPKNQSGRIEQVYLFFADGRIRRWDTNEMRKAFGFSNIRSTKFQLAKTDLGYRFQGIGFGHGVGMCQMGARKMASLGFRFDKILKQYFPNSQLIYWNDKGPILSASRLPEVVSLQ